MFHLIQTFKVTGSGPSAEQRQLDTGYYEFHGDWCLSPETLPTHTHTLTHTCTHTHTHTRTHTHTHTHTHRDTHTRIGVQAPKHYAGRECTFLPT